MYICLHVLQNIVFHFNTRSFVYNISFTHVNFYLGRAFEIFDIPVIVKGFYTQLGIDNRLVVYCSVIYWLINIYLPVTIFWFTCVDKIPRFISIELTPQYYTCKSLQGGSSSIILLVSILNYPTHPDCNCLHKG